MLSVGLVITSKYRFLPLELEEWDGVRSTGPAGSPSTCISSACFWESIGAGAILSARTLKPFARELQVMRVFSTRLRKRAIHAPCGLGPSDKGSSWTRDSQAICVSSSRVSSQLAPELTTKSIGVPGDIGRGKRIAGSSIDAQAAAKLATAEFWASNLLKVSNVAMTALM